MCMLFNTVICPIAAIAAICNMLANHQQNHNPYTQWMFTFVFLTLMPVFTMIKNFNRFGKKRCPLCQKGPYSCKKWKSALFPKEKVEAEPSEF
jgi:hypothetical protein